MKKITLMLIAALMAVVSFAGTPLRKGSPSEAIRVPAERQFVPQHKAVKNISLPTATTQTLKVRKNARKATPRKVASIDDLTGEWMLVMQNLDYDEDADEIVEAEPAMAARPVKFTKSGENTILISGFTSEAELDITATVNLEEGTISIPDGQTVQETNYGPIILSNIMNEGEPLVAVIQEDGTIDMTDQLWYAVIGGTGTYAGYMWDPFIYSSYFVRSNGKMTWSDVDEQGNPVVEDHPLYIVQEPDAPQFAYVFNFAGMETMVVINMKEENSFEISSQLVQDGGTNYGKFYTTGMTENGEDFAALTGTGTETELTFGCYWTLYSDKGYWYGQLSPATIAYTDGSKFVFPFIEDVPATPAKPEILSIGAYNPTRGYGYILANVPNTDAEGNPIKESKLYYTFFSSVKGKSQPIIFSPDNYENLTESLVAIPYSFTDNHDFVEYEGAKLIYLNFDFSEWDEIGIRSIYYGGDATNASDVSWMEIEKVTLNGEFTFDFNSMDVPTSSSASTDGDITEPQTLTSGSVELVVSPKAETATTENRFWGTANGPQLRVYSGSLTFSAPEPAQITKIVFNAGRWANGNSATPGEFSAFSGGQIEWTGSAGQVVIDIAGNTQINSIVVTLGEGGGNEETEDILVELPEGVQPEAWTINGTYGYSDGSERVIRSTQVAFDGNTIYVQGLSYFFEEAWLKGTIANGVATFPTGQFMGEDEDGKEYMIGYADEVICDIQFAYDAEAKTLTQITDYIVENVDVKDELYFYGYWTGLYLYAGEPAYPVTPPADLATTTYLFKSMMQVNEYEEEDDEDYEVKALAAEPKAYENQVLVGFDGDDLYIQGLSEDYPEGWVKATKNADGKYVIPTNQFMGTLEYLWFTFDYYFTAVDEQENLIDAVFTVDTEKKTISTDQTLALNGSLTEFDYYVLFTNVSMTEMQEIAVAPADPTIVAFEYTEDPEYFHIELDIPAKGVNGEDLIKSKMAYQLYVLKEGQAEPLVLTTGLYESLTEDMSIIPYNFTDDWDIYRGGEAIYLNQGVDEILSWSKIGVKSINYAGGETHESNIVWFDLDAYWEDPTRIADIATAGTVRYFDLSGRVTSAQQKGLVIKQVRQQDGSLKTVKVIRK